MSMKPRPSRIQRIRELERQVAALRDENAMLRRQTLPKAPDPEPAPRYETLRIAVGIAGRGGNAVSERLVHGTVVGYLGVHRTLGAPLGAGAWTVTHLQTGMAVARWENERGALLVAETIRSLLPEDPSPNAAFGETHSGDRARELAAAVAAAGADLVRRGELAC